MGHNPAKASSRRQEKTTIMRGMKVIFVIQPLGIAVEPVLEALAAQPAVQSLDAAHVMTPLAYLGYYDKVHKAPYDHVLAADSQRLFVEELPGREQDYIAACRAYADTMYNRAAGDAEVVVDATPGYAQIVPFLLRIFPDAVFVVATENPLASLSRIKAADVKQAIREIEGAVALLGRLDHSVQRVTLEQWGQTRDTLLADIGRHVDREFTPVTGDSAYDDTWAQYLAENLPERERLQRLVKKLPDSTLAVYGYPRKTLWEPVAKAAGRTVRGASPGPIGKLRNAAWTQARRTARQSAPVNRILRKARLACDVLLRD
jgi:hypothetical protein